MGVERGPPILSSARSRKVPTTKREKIRLTEEGTPASKCQRAFHYDVHCQEGHNLAPRKQKRKKKKKNKRRAWKKSGSVSAMPVEKERRSSPGRGKEIDNQMREKRQVIYSGDTNAT